MSYFFRKHPLEDDENGYPASCHYCPQDGKFYNTGKVQDPKTLILLHGLSDNSSAWVRYTALERYAEQYNLLIAMPEVQRSFYTDMKYGIQYEKYVAEELPFILENLFHTSTAPGDLIIAGFIHGRLRGIENRTEIPGEVHPLRRLLGRIIPH